MFVALIASVTRVLTSLRYRITIEGAENLPAIKGPALVLPNHPGYIDPVLVTSRLGAKFHLRPMVTTGMYRLPLLLPVLRGLHALEVPSMEVHSNTAHEEVDEIIRRVVAGLDRGEKFLIYPSGRIEHDGLEHIGSAWAVSDILEQRPETTVVLLRTSGLWGSMGTMAVTGKSPVLRHIFWRAVWILLSNFIFFTPRRRIRMTLEVVPSKGLPGFEREKLNPFLEEWYNRGLSPEPIFVPYHFLFGPRTFAYSKPVGPYVPLDQIEEETKKGVFGIVEKKLKRPLREEDKEPETSLDLLGLDSFDRMDVAQEVGQRFGFNSAEVATTMGELWALAQGLASSGPAGPVKIPKSWNKPPSEAEVALSFPGGGSLLEAFVGQAIAHPGEAAAADELSGVVTYERMVIGAWLMRKRFAGLPGDAVGLMLPASVAADIAFLALLWAAKLPVLLNWTTGTANLDHAAKVMGVRRVVTSRKFIDRVGIKIEGVEYVFLEDVREGIGRLEMLGGFLSARLASRKILAGLPVTKPDQPAAVLFTSGSEKAPKAVPLTHANILADIAAGSSALVFKRGDVILGFLPPFHSFGLSGNMMLPLLGGMRVVHHADPTDAAGLVRKIAAYKPTVLLSTPTFFQHILNAGKSEELASLRLIITGAEKCPDATFVSAGEKIPGAFVAEGYGITECSPVVSVNRPGSAKAGTIGRPLDGVEVRVVDPDSMQPLESEKQGMLLVHGPTVFPGYLHYDGPSPFHELDGKRWYITGDLAKIDSEGFIQFAGRLKRFLKVGGEMISLPALEHPLAEAYPPGENGPQMAVEGIELEKGRRIALFTTAEMPLERANELLLQAGFRGIMRFDEVRRVDQIPVLGTGKTDYKVLRAQLADGKITP